jgi:signal transduction histidine kinase
MRVSRALLALAVAGLAWTAGAAGQGDAPDRPRRVLILHTDRVDLPANAILNSTIRTALEAGGVGRIDLYVEYLDVSRFPGSDHARLQSEFLRQRYANKKPEVVITISDSAVDFLVRYGAGLFPGTPIVVGSTERRGIRNWPLPRGITGAVSTVQFRGTLELMMALHPNTRRVVILAGTSGVDRYWAEQMIRDAHAVAPGVEVVDTGPLPMAQLLRELGSQPPQTVILYHTLFQDGAGETFLPAELVPAFTKAANAPLYGVYTTQIGRGIVGGYLWSFEKQGAKVAEIALRILRGERAEDIPLVNFDGNAYVFDWRQLQRWNIPERRLPADAIVMFREPSLLERYRYPLIALIAALALQTALIIALLLQRRLRRSAELGLRAQRVELLYASRLALAGELTASIAHEINQPLAAILSNADAVELLLQKGQIQKGDLLQIMADIKRDDLRASKVIKRLGALLARHEVEHRRFDLHETIQQAMTILTAEAGRRSAKIETKADATAVDLIGDPVQIQQVLINLVLNALDASENLPPERRRVQVETSDISMGVQLTVRDFGHGIAEADLPRLFDSFFTTKGGGMGLGLSIARSIVEAHGGTIKAEVRAVGAAFVVVFPRASTDPAEKAGTPHHD